MAVIKCGTYIIVSDKAKSYKGRYNGCRGVICQTYTVERSYGVKLDDNYNTASKNGYFWFKHEELEIDYTTASEEEEYMNTTKEIYKTVRVRFEDGSAPFTQFACYIDDINLYDDVLVQTKHHGKAVATIEEIVCNGTVAEPMKREVICKLDMSEFNGRKDRRRRAAELFEMMNQRAQELQTTALFEMMAKTDIEMRSLLDEYIMLAK